LKNPLLIMLLAGLVGACSKEAPPPKAAETPVAHTQAARGQPGVGLTPGAATGEALKSAIAQVNGTYVDAASISTRVAANVSATLDVETSRGSDSGSLEATMNGQSFVERIVAQTNGLVLGFRVLKITTPAAGAHDYTVEVEAKIARYKAPVDAGKVRIVVARLRSKQQAFNIGGRSVPADEVLEPLRRRIEDALTQTGRFTVLDRDTANGIDDELALIGSGEVAKTDMAKLGQALSADLVWVGVVDALSYDRHARQLQMSDRSLVSYSGGWALSQRLVNLATRQIVQSGSLQGTPLAKAATTMDIGIDAHRVLQDMETEIVAKTTEAILLRSFPVTIVERDGDSVVLNQGGAALKTGSRYRVYRLGKALKDPQTGQSLGNMETPCCEVVVDRVTPSLSYGRLENVVIKLDDIQPGALQIREAIVDRPAAPPNGMAQSAVVTRNPARQVRSAAAPTPAKSSEKDDW